MTVGVGAFGIAASPEGASSVFPVFVSHVDDACPVWHSCRGRHDAVPGSDISMRTSMDVGVRPTMVGVARNVGGSTSTTTLASSTHVLPLFPAASMTATQTRSGPPSIEDRSFSAKARVPTHVSRYSARLVGSAG